MADTLALARPVVREEVRDVLRSAPAPYYIYVLSKPCGTPFYVGKGQGDRVLNHERDAIQTTKRSHKLNLIRSLHAAGVAVGYSFEFFIEESAALERERHLIQHYGRHDLGTGPLTNMTDGGEGPANFSEETRQRHRDTLAGVLEDGSARSAVNAFFRRFGIEVDSVPIKPLSDGPRVDRLVPHSQPRRPQPRQAAALAAMVVGNDTLLKPGVRLRRRFMLDDDEVILENGAGKDLLKSGMLCVFEATPGCEVLEVTPLGYAETLRLVGEEQLVSLGALMPEPTL